MSIQKNVPMDHKKLSHQFKERFGNTPDFIASAPGRVNLIGEHTDYNDGFVFPVAIDRYIHIVGSKRNDRQIHLHALDINETCQFSLDTDANTDLPGWSNYPKGVAHLLQDLVLQDLGLRLNGMSALITGDVPIGAGLSSSAALEVASVLSFLSVCGLAVTDTSTESKYFLANHSIELLDIPATELAALCQRAENEYAGVQCGIMDPTISLLGKSDHALFLDCRSLEYRHVPLYLKDTLLVICNTNVKRELASSEYNNRRAECEKGVEILQKWKPDISSLRDVTLNDLKKYEAELPYITQKRCRYVITENARVENAVSALTRGDLDTFGHLMNASHEGLRDEYEVSCHELDILTEIAQNTDGVIGARMTGAGFGGCTVNLVKKDSVAQLNERVMTEYPKRTKTDPDIYVCNIGDGARIKWNI